MIKNTNAFILSYNQYKNSSIIASFLTDNSIIQAICYRAKKNSKSFGSDLESISKLNINIYKKNENHLSIL
ncbi:recombination protein O N-terminal domain-containing protein, partial [uncultured Brachyspira sp.]